MKIYLAGPIFSNAEITWIVNLKDELAQRFKNKIHIIFPFEIINGDIESGAKDVSVIGTCVEGLEEADLLLAVLDGIQVDDGTAWEVGYFFAKNRKNIWGLRTDTRNAGDSSTSIVNVLIEESIDYIFATKELLFENLTNKLNEQSQQPPRSRSNKT